MATAIQKLTDQIVNHIVIYNYTVQMRENVYMTMVHAIRDRTSGSFETLKEQGPAAYIVIFEEEYQEIGKQLFNYLKQTVEAEVKRNDAGNSLLVGKDESQNINNGGQKKNT